MQLSHGLAVVQQCIETQGKQGNRNLLGLLGTEHLLIKDAQCSSLAQFVVTYH